MTGTPGGAGKDGEAGSAGKSGEAGGARVLRGASALEPLSDWGPIARPRDPGPITAPGNPGPAAAPIGGVSRTRGLLLYRAAGGFPEAGVWECTPGTWECRVARDEFCHFLAGRCVYTHDSGARLEIAEGDTAWFPAGWSGRCEVIETVRKVYVIR